MAGMVAISAALLLQFAAVVDGTGEVLPGNEVVVMDGRIIATGEHLHTQFPDAERVDLSHLTAIPGLIDAHVHVTYGLSTPPQGDAWDQLLQRTSAAERLDAGKVNAERMLQQGITSARDLFALDGVDFQLRALIESGEIKGPRLFLSGMGIHPLVMPALTDPQADPQQRITAMAQRAIEVADSGAGWLKIFATSGTADDLSGDQIYRFEEIKAATHAAHARGLKVALHAYGPSAVPDAIRAGVDSIEHAVDVDDETLQAWAASGIPYVPTIDHNRYYADHREEYGYDAAVEAQLHEFSRRNVEMLRRAHAAGITIVFGSDAVMSMFGQNTRELEWFVQAGLTPAETLQSATVNAASLLGQYEQLGRISAGYQADLIAVDGNPLEDITVLTRRVVWVMQGGKVVYERALANGDSQL